MKTSFLNILEIFFLTVDSLVCRVYEKELTGKSVLSVSDPFVEMVELCYFLNKLLKAEVVIS